MTIFAKAILEMVTFNSFFLLSESFKFKNEIENDPKMVTYLRDSRAGTPLKYNMRYPTIREGEETRKRKFLLLATRRKRNIPCVDNSC